LLLGQHCPARHGRCPLDDLADDPQLSQSATALVKAVTVLLQTGWNRSLSAIRDDACVRRTADKTSTT
jgi:hypothetical protein